MSATATLTAFDHERRYFIQITHDYRIKIYDVALGSLLNEFTEPNHLTANYTSIAYTSPSTANSSTNANTSTATSKSKKRSSAAITNTNTAALNSAHSLGFLALGSRSGAITLFNLTSGESVHISPSTSNTSNDSSQPLSLAHNGVVTALCFSTDGTRLFSAGADNVMKGWMISSSTKATLPTVFNCIGTISTKSSVQCMALLANGSELICAEGLSIYTVAVSGSQFRRARSYTGMTSTIVSISLSIDEKYFASSGDRFVSIWETSPKAKASAGTERNTALHTNALPSTVRQVAFSKMTSDSTYTLSALCDVSSISILSFTPSAKLNGSSTSPNHVISVVTRYENSNAAANGDSNSRVSRALRAETHRQERVERGNKKKQRKHAMAATTVVDENDSDDNSIADAVWTSSAALLVAFHQNGKLIFENVKISEADGTIKPLVVLQSEDNTVNDSLISSVEGISEKKRKKDVHVLSTADFATSAPQSAITASAPVLPSTTSSAQLVQSLADRVAELERSSGMFASDRRVLLSGQRNSMPTTGTVQTLLTQALHTNDEALFEYCLSLSLSSLSSSQNQHSALNSASFVVPSSLQATIQRVPTSYVLPLLQRLVSTLNYRPSRATALLSWIRAVLTVHTAYLLSLPPATFQAAVAPLNALMESRLSASKKIRKLKGRLELLMVQMKHSQQEISDVQSLDAQRSHEPLNVWRESEHDSDNVTST